MSEDPMMVVQSQSGHGLALTTTHLARAGWWGIRGKLVAMTPKIFVQRFNQDSENLKNVLEANERLMLLSMAKYLGSRLERIVCYRHMIWIELTTPINEADLLRICAYTGHKLTRRVDVRQGYTDEDLYLFNSYADFKGHAQRLFNKL